jgi:hypothetical protein
MACVPASRLQPSIFHLQRTLNSDYVGLVQVLAHEDDVHVPEECRDFKIAVYSSKNYVKSFLEKPLRRCFPRIHFIEVEASLSRHCCAIAAPLTINHLFAAGTGRRHGAACCRLRCRHLVC